MFTAGHSSGGYLALQSALLVTPRPRGILLVAAQGGNFLHPLYFVRKEMAAKLKTENIDAYLDVAHPDRGKILAVTGAPIESSLSGLRVAVDVAMHQLGLKLDAMTGRQGLSAKLREAEDVLEMAIEEDLRWLFPELMIPQADGFPRVWAVHGTRDRTVPCREAERIIEMVEGVGGIGRLVKVMGWGHGEAEEAWEMGGKGCSEFFELALVEEDGV